MQVFSRKDENGLEKTDVKICYRKHPENKNELKVSRTYTICSRL